MSNGNPIKATNTTNKTPAPITKGGHSFLFSWAFFPKKNITKLIIPNTIQVPKKIGNIVSGLPILCPSCSYLLLQLQLLMLLFFYASNVLIPRQEGNWILLYSTVDTKNYYLEKRRPFWSGVLNCWAILII